MEEKNQKLFSIQFSRDPKNNLKMSMEFQTTYAGVDLMRVLVGGLEGMIQGVYKMGTKLGFSEDQIVKMIDGETNCFPTSPPPATKTETKK